MNRALAGFLYCKSIGFDRSEGDIARNRHVQRVKLFRKRVTDPMAKLPGSCEFVLWTFAMWIPIFAFVLLVLWSAREMMS